MMNGALRRLNDVTHLEIMKESVLENRIGLIDWVNSVWINYNNVLIANKGMQKGIVLDTVTALWWGTCAKGCLVKKVVKKLW